MLQLSRTGEEALSHHVHIYTNKPGILELFAEYLDSRRTPGDNID